jgi:hypothetical protein
MRGGKGWNAPGLVAGGDMGVISTPPGNSERVQQALSSAATYAPPPQQVNTANPESPDHS